MFHYFVSPPIIKTYVLMPKTAYNDSTYWENAKQTLEVTCMCANTVEISKKKKKSTCF